MRPLPLLVLILSVLFVTSPFWSGQFDGFEAAQLPIPQEDPPIQPPGVFFSVWTLIYLGLLASAAFGVWKRADDPDWDRARAPLAVSLAVGVPWLWVAQRSAEAATLMIVLMAMTAIWALRAAPGRDRWWLEAPVGLYAGWLTAAAWVSIAAVGAGYGVLTGSLGWAFLGVLGALLVAVPVLLARASFGYAFTASWALLGIAVKNAGPYPGLAALAAAGIVTLLAIWWARRDRVVGPA
jgi:hypothetical protein